MMRSIQRLIVNYCNLFGALSGYFKLNAGSWKSEVGGFFTTSSNFPLPTFISILLFLCGFKVFGQNEHFKYNPKSYVCHKTTGLLAIDGKLNEEDWTKAEWTEKFVDIEGSKKPLPKYDTRVKMLWDDDYFYIAAHIEEPHIWATITERDAVIFNENDFEVFIDPDGDTHNYYEFEINALGTHWDLMLLKPYMNGGPPINAWDIRGVKKGINIEGTINDPSDTDQQWTVELAFPWEVLKEAAPGRRKPKDGEHWRINFSRVNWDTTTTNGSYKKKTNSDKRKPLPEYNWVWSPQGVINMHKPEYWGYVKFSKEGPDSESVTFIPNRNENLKWILRNIYYAQKAYYKENKQYTDQLDQLQIPISIPEHQLEQITISATPLLFQISIPAIEEGYYWHIKEDSKIWKTQNH